MKRITVWLIVIPLVLSGCLPTAGGNRNIGQKSGSGEEFIQGGVVAGFPQLPLYPEVKVIESYGYKDNFGASFVTDDGLTKVVNFYSESLPKLGWDASLGEASSTNFVFEIKNSQSSGSIIVNTASDNRKTAITIAVAPR